jgi:BirA family biotin operon repressor/biotin-[acetyl-CoA-carboxylase] ligase
MKSKLTSDRLSAYIEHVELPARKQFWPETEARKILRLGGFVGSQIDHHSSLARSMDQARVHIGDLEQNDHSVANGTAIIADTLRGPKGRFTRTWHAPIGGLWGNLIYISTLLPRFRLLVPIAVGVAGCEAVRASGADHAVVRWINDVLIDDMKVAGFLIEHFTGERSKEEYYLIGFGININNLEFPSELQKLATSLRQELGRSIDLETFSYCFLAKLSWNLGLLYYQEQIELEQTYNKDTDQHPLIRRWSELSDSLGRRVVFGFDVINNPQFQATVSGIEADGGLKLVLEDGTELVEYSGEIRYLD